MARNRKLTPELIEEIASVIRAGNYIETACEYCGIQRRRFYDWKERGDRELDRREAMRIEAEDLDEIGHREQLFVDFVETVARSRAAAEAEAVAQMRELARGKMRGLDGNMREVDDRVRLESQKFFLERSFPDRWGRRVIDASVNVAGGVELIFELPTPGIVGAPEEVEDDGED